MTRGRQQWVAFLEIHYNDVTTYWLQWKHPLHKMYEHYYDILLLIQSFILNIYFNSIVPVLYGCLFGYFLRFCKFVDRLKKNGLHFRKQISSYTFIHNIIQEMNVIPINKNTINLQCGCQLCYVWYNRKRKRELFVEAINLSFLSKHWHC